jgi:hypothetical protein
MEARSNMATTGNIDTSSNLAMTTKGPWCRPRATRNSGCCIATAVPPQRPDLATYSQLEQISLGNAPTWNSPDITTNNEFPWTLLPTFFVNVRNLSAVASAINALVTMSTSPFGIGMTQTPLSSQRLSLGPGQTVALSFTVPPALLAGAQSLGTFVDIRATYDSKLINNSGAQVLTGIMASAGGRNPALAFSVLNSMGAGRTISLSVLPNALGASVSPASQAFAPWEQITATLNINVPAAMHGSPGSPIYNEVTVVAYAADGSLVGGATWIYWVDN